MGHLASRDIYRKLGKKIDGLTVRVPWNERLYAMLAALYTPEEADLLVRMPYGLSSLGRLQRISGLEAAELRKRLDSLCEKGLVLDIWTGEKFRYTPAPLAVGIFEMTMMRTRGELAYGEWARLFNEYMHGDASFYEANFGHGEQVSIMRALPHESAIAADSTVEVLDYEKASAIIEEKEIFSIGLCSCRHEKLHAGEKSCSNPLETCSSFGSGAEMLIRHGFARQVSKTEMLENLDRSRQLKLVLTADNVRENVGFICHCCGDCCNLLQGVSRHGYPNTIVTSSFIAHVEQALCTGCEKCARACPIQAIEMVKIEQKTGKKPKDAVVDESICLGCGVCALSCHKGAVRLVKREQRVLHPANTFERVLLQSLERGNLQNFLFDEPQKLTHAFLRGLLGGFLRLPPIKQALMSETLRSRYLAVLGAQAKTRQRQVLERM